LKKYLKISEVEELLGVSKPSLRYIEKSRQDIKIHKIRGRRYYSSIDIEKISAALLERAESNIPDTRQLNIFSSNEKIITYPILNEERTIDQIDNNDKIETNKDIALRVGCAIIENNNSLQISKYNKLSFLSLKSELQNSKNKLVSLLN
jgi:DNA-binding transcriptional MerR regulator